MREIILKKRYPHSRSEDITDAFMRGYEKGKADRPQGEWIKNYYGTVICSECKCPRRDSRVGHTNFCNSCGAKMVKDDE